LNSSAARRLRWNKKDGDNWFGSIGISMTADLILMYNRFHFGCDSASNT
jgi:hypothetical protein